MAEHRSSGAGMCVLVVDDDLEIRETVRQVLESEGYQVAAASDGAEALDLLHGGVVPRLILLDLMMPIMNGWQLREALRGDAKLETIPIVVFTGAGNAAANAESLQAAGYITKPVDLEPLLACVARFCRAA
jgi:CheY-like chemotaxis protein